VQRSC